MSLHVTNLEHKSLPTPFIFITIKIRYFFQTEYWINSLDHKSDSLLSRLSRYETQFLRHKSKVKS